ncbi:MAG: hypothetical protein AAF432_06590 [Planctomycetota bacterium]
MNMCASVLSWFRRRGGMATLAVVVLLSSPAMAQSEGEEPFDLLDNFVHYAIIGNADLTIGYGQALLDSGLTDAELATLVDDGSLDESRFNEAISWSQRVSELEPIVSEIAIRVERGRLDLARDGGRIAEAIAMLGGNQRQRLLAMKRLEAAGEYAVPPLLQELTDGEDQGLKPKVEQALVSIGRQAVDPLCVALSELDQINQRRICDMLATIAYPHAGPALKSLAMSDGVEPAVRQAAERAFSAVGAPSNASEAELWAQLGRRYFTDPTSLTAYPTEPVNNVWDFDAFVGLVATPVPTEIFGEVKAMQLASKALSLEPSNTDALALFVAANLNRENDLPQGEDDPVYGQLAYSPSFFATVFGTSVCQDVLGMAIDRVDTPLVRDAIQALSQTTGGSNLFGTGAGRQPLLEALTYPDRRVQYEAALTLARALPQSRFVGDAQVIPILASAVRNAGDSYAMVIADDVESRQTLSGLLGDGEFTLVGVESSYDTLRPSIQDSVGIDVIVIQMDTAQEAVDAIDGLRSNAKTIATPVLLRSAGDDMSMLRTRYTDDARVLVVPRAGAEAFDAGIDQLLTRAAGGRIGEADAEAYAIEALSAMRDVAINRSPAFRMDNAEPALLEALGSREGGMRMLVSDVLALMSSSRSQQALFDAALAENDEFDQIELLDRVASSVRRFGNLSERRHVEGLVDLIGSAGGDTAEAAARVHGAMNVFDSEATMLVPGG